MRAEIKYHKKGKKNAAGPFLEHYQKKVIGRPDTDQTGFVEVLYQPGFVQPTALPQMALILRW